MKKTVIFVVTLLLIVNLGLAYAQAQQTFEDAIMQGKKLLKNGMNTFDETTLLQGRSLFERLLMKEEKQDLIHYYIGYADYRLATKYMQSNNLEEAKKYLDDGITHLEKSLDANDKFAEAHALVSSLYGQKIMYDMSQAMVLGQLAHASMKTAKLLDPENPRITILEAISTYFTPEQYGGSKENGYAMMDEALKYFAKYTPKEKIHPDWGHAEAFSFLAFWKLSDGDTTSAVQNLEKALKTEADYGWAIEMKKSLKTKPKK